MSKNSFFTNKMCLLTTTALAILIAPLAYYSLGCGFESVQAQRWSGYIVKTNYQSSWQGFSSVSASWIVPEVKASVNNTFLSVWVGIGGYGEESLIQAGIEGHCINGQVEYSAWYELLPDFARPISSVTVKSGDNISVSITLINEKQTWSIMLADNTNNKYFQKNVVYNSSRLTAEWIVERPTINNAISVLPDFDNVTFSNCKAVLNGIAGKLILSHIIHLLWLILKTWFW